ncbi:MAG TPA: DUF362 domain-containing protein [Caldithrix sp.]|nr:DUF362 domain-containing protein [Caldithrix sp.]
MNSAFDVNRRTFLKSSSLVGAGIVLGTPHLWAQDKTGEQKPSKPETNIKDILKIERTENSMPGKFPGKVVKVSDSRALVDNVYDAEVIQRMFEKGMQSLSGKDMQQTFDMLFTRNDIIGIKVNPVGAGLISTRLELVDSIIKWLTGNGIPENQIIIWDRFDYMLTDAGFTKERFPGIGIEGLQTMDEAAAEGKTDDNSKWLDADGNHVSLPLFDQAVFYYADVEAPQDLNYLNQHVVNTKYSYFGKLLTQKLTKIINVPVFKNTGNGISMATKNIGYAAICNTGRLHRPLFFDVCTEVLAFPCVRDKMVLNITDGLRGQYDGGPGPNASFVYDYNTLFFATDLIALDMTCHNILVQKRKEMKVDVNEHPKYTEYLRYAQELNLGIADPGKIEVIEV